MRIIVALALLIGLGSCHTEQKKAQAIVKRQLGNPAFADFRRIRVKPSDATVVCGEVDASDRPGSGWRAFVAYLSLDQAVVAPPGGLSAAAEGGNPLIQGEAERFNHTCDR